jgi:hypothetical protein
MVNARSDYHQINLDERDKIMLWTIAIILVVLWLVGLLTSFTLGGFIHALLVIAVIVVVVRLIQGRKIA